MADKSWMLNAKAIAAARKCMCVVQSELGIKLKLSHPDFLELLVDYAELNESLELHKALAVLAQFAPANINARLTHTGETSNIVNLEAKSIFIRPRNSSAAVAQVQQTQPQPLRPAEPELASTPAISEEPTVYYNGRNYPRYRDGAEFKGLYRGQPRYV